MKGSLFMVTVGEWDRKYVFADDIQQAIQRAISSVEIEYRIQFSGDIDAMCLCAAGEVITND